MITNSLSIMKSNRLLKGCNFNVWHKNWKSNGNKKHYKAPYLINHADILY